jgi:hypothetical protein
MYCGQKSMRMAASLEYAANSIHAARSGSGGMHELLWTLPLLLILAIN